MQSSTTHSLRPDDAASDDLHVALQRMRSYARALEQRCGRLWTYIPDTHGRQDPAIPFLASEYLISETDRDPDPDAR